MTNSADYQAYERAHSNCPQCGGDTIEQTTIGYIMTDPATHVDKNRADCGTCSWSGITHDLVPAVSSG